MDTLKDRLRRAMAGPPKISQASLALACKVKPPSVNNWLSGKTKVLEGPNLLAAARHLGVNPDWLATGRGPMRNNSALPNLPSGTGELPSQSVSLDPDMLHEALTLLVHDESHAGPYTPRARTMRLAELYSRVAADGGRLTKEHNEQFVAEIRSRAEGVASGDELAGHRSATGKRVRIK